MDQRPIGVIDSGIGGISILNEVAKYLPGEKFIYYADSIHNPYGNKTKEELIEIMDQITKTLLKENVKLIIIACNTASTQVISYLREHYPSILFVAVEPAIKVAFDHYADRNVLLMATPGTIKSDRLMELDEKYRQENRILLPCANLAALIENQELEKIPAYLQDLLKNIDTRKIEVVVLGCTHYPFIKDEIEEAIGHTVTFIDGAAGVKKRVKFLLDKNNIKNLKRPKAEISFILTDETKSSVIEKYLER